MASEDCDIPKSPVDVQAPQCSSPAPPIIDDHTARVPDASSSSASITVNDIDPSVPKLGQEQQQGAKNPTWYKTSQPPLSILSAARRWTQDSWTIEISSMLLSVIAMFAIVIVLAALDQKPLRLWTFFITLNGTIATFSVIVQTGMVMTAAECVAQQKWLSFQTSRELSGFDVFDEISRGGLLASAKFVIRIRSFRSVAVVGAVVALANVAFGPFTQQLVEYPLRQQVKASNQVLSSRAIQFTRGLNTIDWSARAALDTSLLQPKSLYSYKPTCPTGNCTWEPFPSLAVCSNCKTLDNWATDCGSDPVGELDCTYNFPGITSFPIRARFDEQGGQGPQYLSDSSLGLDIANAELDLGDSLATFAAIAFNRSATTIEYGKPWRSDICSLFLCIQTWNVNVVNINVENTNVVSTWHNNTPTNANVKGQRTLYQDLVLRPSAQDLNLPVVNNSFLVTGNALYALEQELKYIFSGNTTTFRNGSTWSDSATFGDITRSLAKNPTGPLVESAALALTEYFRTSPENIAFNVTGNAVIYETIIAVRWAWTTLPLFLTILTVLLLVITMYSSRKKVLWKSSNLPLLLYGPSSQDIEVGNARPSVLGHLSDRTTMMVRNDDGRWRVTIEIKGEGSKKDPEKCQPNRRNSEIKEPQAMLVQDQGNQKRPDEVVLRSAQSGKIAVAGEDSGTEETIEAVETD